jgi:tripartite-type tricarboxylate transporter receptor subunit TctC
MAHYVVRLALGFACFCAFLAAADEFPSKVVKIIVPYPAGTTGDFNAREFATFVSPQLHQQIIVENRPGAGGNIGTQIGIRANPDGYTVLFVTGATIALSPHLYTSVTLDPLKDLTLLVVHSRSAGILLVNASSEMKSLADLIAAASAKPGGLTLANSGPGSIQHLMGERLEKIARIDLVNVSYKGDAPTLTDLIGGQIDAAFSFAVVAVPHIRSGKLRPLAVTGVKRLAVLPDVPTMAEAGLTGYDERVWAGFAVPAATPKPIVEKLHKAFYSAASLPEYRRLVEQRGTEPLAMNQEEATTLLRSDYERYGRIVKELGIHIE